MTAKDYPGFRTVKSSCQNNGIVDTDLSLCFKVVFT